MKDNEKPIQSWSWSFVFILFDLKFYFLMARDGLLYCHKAFHRIIIIIIITFGIEQMKIENRNISEL